MNFNVNMNSLWERLIVDWVNCLEIDGIINKKCYKNIKCDDMDQIAKYIILKEGFEDYSNEKKEWALQFFCDKFPSLSKVYSLRPHTEEFIVAWLAMIVYCCLSLKDKYMLSRMCSMEQDHQILLKSLFSSFVNMNLSLTSYSHFVEVLCLITGDVDSNSCSFSTPLSYSNANSSRSTPRTYISVKQFDEKCEEINLLKQKIAEYDYEKDDLSSSIKELRSALSARDKEISHQKHQITLLNADIETLRDDAACDRKKTDVICIEEHYSTIVHELKKSLDEEVRKVSLLEERLEETKEKVNRVRSEKLEFKNKCQHLEFINCELEGKLSEMLEIIDNLTKRNQELDAFIKESDCRSLNNCSLNSEDISFTNLNCSDSNNIGNFLLMESQAQLEEAKKKCDEKEKIVIELTDKLRISEESLIEKQSDVNIFTTKIQWLQESLYVLTDKLQTADKCLELYEIKMDSLKSALSSLYNERQSLRNSLETSKLNQNELEKLYKQALEEADTIKNQLSLCLEEMASKNDLIKEDLYVLYVEGRESELMLLSKFEYFLENASILEDEIMRLHRNYVHLKQEIKVLKNSEDILLNEKFRLEQRIALMESSLNAKDMVIEEKEYLKNSAAIELDKKVTYLQNHLANVELSLSEAKSLITSLNNETETLKSQVQGLNKEVALKEKAIKDKEFFTKFTVKELNKQISCLQARIASLESNQSQVGSMEEKMKTLEAEIQTKQKLLSQESHKYEDLKGQFVKKMEVYKETLKKSYNKDMKNREELYLKKIKELKTKISKLEECKENLCVQVKEDFVKPQNKTARGGNKKVEHFSLRARSPVNTNLPKKISQDEEFSEHYKRMMLQEKPTEDDNKRLDELKARNSKLLPHLQTCYPGETQMLSPSKFSESEFKEWCRDGRRDTIRLRQRSYNDLHRMSENFFIPMDRKLSQSQDVLSSIKKKKGS